MLAGLFSFEFDVEVVAAAAAAATFVELLSLSDLKRWLMLFRRMSYS